MKRLFTASILAAAFASGAAFAQVGPYVGASIGQSNYSSDSCVGNCDKTDIAMKLFGGYMFTPYLGAELDYGWYGKAKIGVGSVNAEAEADGFSGFLVAQYPVDNFRVFGKLGFARLNTTITANAPGVRFDNNDASFEFAWGVGGSYMFNKQLGVRAEYEARKYKVEGTSDTLGLFSIGVQYNF
jgi:opacity protein-like surface antigen